MVHRWRSGFKTDEPKKGKWTRSDSSRLSRAPHPHRSAQTPPWSAAPITAWWQTIYRPASKRNTENSSKQKDKHYMFTRVQRRRAEAFILHYTNDTQTRFIVNNAHSISIFVKNYDLRECWLMLSKCLYCFWYDQLPMMIWWLYLYHYCFALLCKIFYTSWMMEKLLIFFNGVNWCLCVIDHL